MAIFKPLFQLIQPDRNSPWKLRTAALGDDVYRRGGWYVPDRKVSKRAEGSKGDAMVVASGAVVVARGAGEFLPALAYLVCNRLILQPFVTCLVDRPADGGI